VAAAAVVIASGAALLPLAVLLGLATYLVSSRLTRRVSILATVAAAVTIGGALFYAALSEQSAPLAVLAVEGFMPIGAAWFVGDAVAARRRYQAGLAEQERREQAAEAERARQQVREERVRIARELHDVVAHTLAVITIQAGVGRRLMAKRPEKTANALELIEEIGRTAQEELHMVLGLLRDEEVEPNSRTPVPRLADVKELVETVQASGTQVELRTRGADRSLSPALELSIYRVVQEALTNREARTGSPGHGRPRRLRRRCLRRGHRQRWPVARRRRDDATFSRWYWPRDCRDARTRRRLRGLALGRTPRRRRVSGLRSDPDQGRAMTIRVLVVDDQELLRAAISSLRDEEDDLEVVGGAADGREAVELVSRVSPDVVVMDVRMPGMDGIEATRRITSRDQAKTPRVLILTTFDLDEYVFEALRAGASGFTLKNRPLEELLSAIRVVARGEALLAPSVTRRLIAHFTNGVQPSVKVPNGLNLLTGRERQVLCLLAQGLSNAELVEMLHVSLPTVTTHVSRILTKLGARDRTQLVVIAYESGLVTTT
jgi:DNA-binding NarL/FixJ family response regulator